MIFFFASLSAFTAADSIQTNPVAWVEISNINVEHGLSLLDGGDGQNEPADIGGSECRVNAADTDPPSRYLYFDYDPSFAKLRRPIYVTIEYFDEGISYFKIQYDSADLAASERGAYKEGATEVLLDSREWRKITFELSDARFDGRQNMGADFRLFCSGRLAIRRVVIEMESSTSFDHQPRAQAKRIADCAGKLSPAVGSQVIFSGPEALRSCDEAQAISDLRILAPMMKAIGATSMESCVRWDIAQPTSSDWNWEYYDNIVAILKENGLKWTPHLVVGPAYATPEWFRSSNENVFAKCLEHDIESKVQSIWNSSLQSRIDQFLFEFSKRYGYNGTIESVVIGMNGDFGEAIYPVTDGSWASAISGEDHTHLGYWCGDDYARADFKHHFQDQYEDIQKLNAAWQTNYSSFDELAPFVPDAGKSARARLDFLEWYRDRATKWSTLWLDNARKYLSQDIYLCTGGDEQPAHGSDFAALCKAASKVKAGIWITSETSDYAYNFALTRLVASAGAYYKTYYAFKPSGTVTTSGITARAYNAISSKSRGIYTYHSTILMQHGGIAAWSNVYKWFGSGGSRRLQVAVLFPQTALALNWGGFYEKIMLLRDALDFDLVDESMIQDGALARYKVLVLIDGKVIEKNDIARITDWVKSGGVIVACDFGGFTTVEGDSSQFLSLFNTSESRAPSTKVYGSGLSIYVTDGWDGDRKPVTGIVQSLGSISNRAHTNLVSDGLMDGVYVTDLGGYLLVYNSTDHEIEKDIQVAIGRRVKVKLPAGSITKVQE
jgi:hypothetical protein